MNFYRCTLQKITKWVKSFFNSEKKDSEVTKDSLSIRWEDSLAHSADDSHSINNVLGPMLLSKTLPRDVQGQIKKAEPLMAKAFRKSCEWRGIISSRDSESNETTDIQDREEKINLIFIDDKAIHWLPIVAGWAYGAYGNEEIDDADIGLEEGTEEQSQSLRRVNMLTKQVKLEMQIKQDVPLFPMYYSTSPNCLIEKLENLESPLSDQRFRLSFQNQDDEGLESDDEELEKKEILLFDLYLFSDHPDKDNEEIKYFQQVLTLAEELRIAFQDKIFEKLGPIQKYIDEHPMVKETIKETVIEHIIKQTLCWQNTFQDKMLKNDIAAIQKNIDERPTEGEAIIKEYCEKNTFQNDTLNEDIAVIQKNIDERPEEKEAIIKEYCEKKGNEYFSFLTLLPRLIAEIDPSIPIIIFSSTGRREITEKFSGYDNIITCFEKPRVLGYSNTDAQLIRSNFSKAISQAKWLIEVRDKLKLVLNSDLTQEQKQQAQQPEQEESK